MIFDHQQIPLKKLITLSNKVMRSNPQKEGLGIKKNIQLRKCFTNPDVIPNIKIKLK